MQAKEGNQAAKEDDQAAKEENPAACFRRLALVLHASNYDQIRPLLACSDDAAEMAEKLEEAGYELVCRDAGSSKQDMTHAYEKLLEMMRENPKCVVFLYYSGHGLHDGSQGYMLPADFNPLADGTHCNHISVQQILKDLFEHTHQAVVVMDACRDLVTNPEQLNPAIKKMLNDLKETKSGGSGSVIVCSACALGSKAPAGRTLSPYTMQLLDHIFEPGVLFMDGVNAANKKYWKATQVRPSIECLGAVDKFCLTPMRGQKDGLCERCGHLHDASQEVAAPAHSRVTLQSQDGRYLAVGARADLCGMHKQPQPGYHAVLSDTPVVWVLMRKGREIGLDDALGGSKRAANDERNPLSLRCDGLYLCAWDVDRRDKQGHPYVVCQPHDRAWEKWEFKHMNKVTNKVALLSDQYHHYLTARSAEQSQPPFVTLTEKDSCPPEGESLWTLQLVEAGEAPAQAQPSPSVASAQL